MVRFPIRVSIGSVMIGVVILALFFAVYGVERGSKLAGFFVLFLAPVAFVRSDRRLLVSGWIMALYPILIVLSLYATYLAGWVTLGRAPWASQTPKSLGPIVKQFVQVTDLILAGFPVSFWACLVLIGVTIFLRSPDAEGRYRRRDYWPLVNMLVWFLGFGWLMLDAFGMLAWFFD